MKFSDVSNRRFSDTAGLFGDKDTVRLNLLVFAASNTPLVAIEVYTLA